MRRLLLVALLGLVVGGGGVFVALRASRPHAPGDQPGAAGKGGDATARAKSVIYRCPMHPQITSDHPGKCPLCGMDLVLVEDDNHPGSESGAPGGNDGSNDVSGLGSVTIDARQQQLMGVRAVAAAMGPVTTNWNTVGRVVVDPTRVRRVNVKVECYVDHVFVDFVGKAVRKGQPLLSVYSPSLLAAQEEFLLALKTSRRLGQRGPLAESGGDLVAASRRKLQLWDVPESEIARLERTGEPSKSLTLVSPIGGVVTAKSVVEGGTLRPGDTPYEITDLGMVWVMADAYESDLANVRVGMPAELTLASYPGRVFKGGVEFVDPLLDPRSRTAKVHLHFANPRGELSPEMFGEVSLRGKTRTVLRIPADAVIRAGQRDVVFLATGDGRFSPRQIRVGAHEGDVVEVIDGLQVGDKVVTRANFLVDSESRLRATLSALKGK